MEPPPPVLPNQDAEHLRILSILHYVAAGIGALFACFPLIHVAVGAMLVTGGIDHAGGPPALFGLFFVGFGMLFVVLGWAMAVCTFLSGRYLAQRRNRMFSLVIAGLLCTFVPVGTVLGVFTLVVLSRESVRRLYTAR